MKKFLLSLVAVLGLGTMAMADTVTINLNSSTGFTGGSSGYSVSTQGFKISYEKASSTTNCVAPYSDHIRVYDGANLIINGENDQQITKIVFTATGETKYMNSMKVGNTTYSWSKNTLTWTGDANSITFAASGQSRIKSAEITYTAAGTSKTAVELSFGEQKEYTASLGKEFVAPALTVTPTEAAEYVVYTSSNENVAKCVNGSVEIVAEGTTIITAAIPSENETYKATPASYTLKVVDPTSIKDEVTGDSFDGFTSSYKEYSYASDYATYAMYGYKNSGIQWNTNTQPKSGMYINAKPGYKIKSISVESNYNKNIDVYSSATAYNDLSKVTDSSKEATLSTNVKDFTFSSPVDHAALHPAATGTVIVTKVTVNLVVFGEDDIAAPMISFNDNNNVVSLSCDTEGASIYYTVNGEVPTAESTLYDAPFAITEDCTVKAIAIKDGKSSTVASKAITATKVAANVAELLSICQNKDDKAIVGFDATVVYVNGNYVYIVDNQNGAALIYQENNCEKGDVIPAGWAATYSPYNGLAEFKGTLPEITESVEVNYPYVNGVSLDDINRVVILKNVTFEEATLKVSDTSFNGMVNGETVAFRNTFKVESVEAGTYDVFAAVGYYANSTTATLRVIPIAYIPENAHNFAISGAEAQEDFYSVSFGKDQTELEITVSGVHAESVLYYKHEAEAAAVAMRAADHTGFTAATRNEDDTHTITVTTPGTLTLYAYHTPTDTKGEEVKVNVKAYDPSTGIELVGADAAAEVEYFNLQGIRVDNPAAGIFIRRQGNKVSKVVIR